MKTPEEILNQFDSWIEVTYEEEVISTADALKAMEQYAKQRCDEQIQACDKKFKEYTGNGWAELSTPNVITTNTK